jgi:hypothetical protein
MADSADQLSSLKGIAGERHERDHGESAEILPQKHEAVADIEPANNPGLKADAVPQGSAAQKTDSALGHFAAGLAVEQGADPANANMVNKTFSGSSVPLSQEPALAEKIEADAEQASDAVAADHFAKAANQLRDAHQQDKEWLAKHPGYDQNSRT